MFRKNKTRLKIVSVCLASILMQAQAMENPEKQSHQPQSRFYMKELSEENSEEIEENPELQLHQLQLMKNHRDFDQCMKDLEEARRILQKIDLQEDSYLEYFDLVEPTLSECITRQK